VSRTIRLLLAVAVVLAAACVPSLHPLYTARDVVFDSTLVGAWSDSAATEHWRFAPAADNAYQVTYTDDKGRVGVFVGHLTRLGERSFFDFYPDSLPKTANEFWALHLVPMHSFAIVDGIRPRLRIGLLEPKALEKYLKAHPAALRHEFTDSGDLVLTASTAQLQAFFRAHAGDKGLFGERTALVPDARTD
jgi:hypothetical protein